MPGIPPISESLCLEKWGSSPRMTWHNYCENGGLLANNGVFSKESAMALTAFTTYRM